VKPQHGNVRPLPADVESLLAELVRLDRETFGQLNIDPDTIRTHREENS
jgi:hypothetical protein